MGRDRTGARRQVIGRTRSHSPMASAAPAVRSADGAVRESTAAPTTCGLRRRAPGSRGRPRHRPPASATGAAARRHGLRSRRRPVSHGVRRSRRLVPAASPVARAMSRSSRFRGLASASRRGDDPALASRGHDRRRSAGHPRGGRPTRTARPTGSRRSSTPAMLPGLHGGGEVLDVVLGQELGELGLEAPAARRARRRRTAPSPRRRRPSSLARIEDVDDTDACPHIDQGGRSSSAASPVKLLAPAGNSTITKSTGPSSSGWSSVMGTSSR